MEEYNFILNSLSERGWAPRYLGAPWLTSLEVHLKCSKWTWLSPKISGSLLADIPRQARSTCLGWLFDILEKIYGCVCTVQRFAKDTGVSRAANRKGGRCVHSEQSCPWTLKGLDRPLYLSFLCAWLASMRQSRINTVHRHELEDSDACQRDVNTTSTPFVIWMQRHAKTHWGLCDTPPSGAHADAWVPTRAHILPVQKCTFMPNVSAENLSATVATPLQWRLMTMEVNGPWPVPQKTS